MRIVQLLTESRGGPVDHVLTLAPELSRLGHSVCVVGPEELRHRLPPHPGVRWRTWSPRSNRDIASIVQLAKILRAWKPDIVHCQDRKSGLLGRVVARALGLPSVYTLHGAPDGLAYLVPGNARVTSKRRRDRLMYLNLERTLARMSKSRVVVASLALGDYAQHAIRLPSDTVDVVPNGVDLSQYAGSTNHDGFKVVWLGMMVPVKRLDVLVEALRLAPAVGATLVGDGPLRETIAHQIQNAGISARVELGGFQVRPGDWLAGADVAVLCSDAENCPLSVLQAMASHCAIVATAVGGVPEIVRHEREGLLVSAGDAAGLAKALDRLRTEPELRGRLADAALVRAADYSVERMALGLVATYERAVGGRSVSASLSPSK